MIHKMKLKEDPFYRMKNGLKEIEFRLFDEKRQQIKIGDKIEFSKLPELEEKLVVDVLDLYKANSFEELFLDIYNDEGEARAKVERMRAFYSKDEEKQYGVLGIKVKINTDDLFKSIENYVPFNEQEEVEKRIMLKYLKESNNILTRNNEMAHFTSSAFVFNKERTKVLMAYHKIYDSWGWVGGHSDGDNDLLYVAMKEAMEETGITNVKPIYDDIFTLEIINVNGHEKRGKYVASHAHLNVTYLLEADENEKIHIKEDENSGVAWVPIDEVIGKSTEPWVRDRIYKKILDKFKSENKD